MDKKMYVAPEMESMDVKVEIVCVSPGLPPTPDPTPDPVPVGE